MQIPQDKTKYNARFKYVEVAHYVPSLKSVIREKRNEQPLLIPLDEVPEYARRYDNTGIYTSILQYDSEHLDSATSLGSLCFDMDSNDLEQSRRETNELVTYLLSYIPESGMQVYFSGGKGFHIECEPIPLNVSSTDDLSGVYGFIARDLSQKLVLESCDLVVYDKRRMWRVANSRHQRTGLFKVECMQLLRDSSGLDAFLKHAETPQPLREVDLSFNPKGNAWFREYAYQYEGSKKKQQEHNHDLLGRFLESGTHRAYSGDYEKKFDKFKLFMNCPASQQLVNKAFTLHHLDHYERLFLCSLLTYTDEAIKYLHEILSQCDDYDFNISSSHIEDWVRRREYEIGGRPFTCDKARQVGILCSGCDKMEPKNKLAHLSDGTVVQLEEVSAPSPVRHAYSMQKGIQHV